MPAAFDSEFLLSSAPIHSLKPLLDHIVSCLCGSPRGEGKLEQGLWNCKLSQATANRTDFASCATLAAHVPPASLQRNMYSKEQAQWLASRRIPRPGQHYLKLWAVLSSLYTGSSGTISSLPAGKPKANQHSQECNQAGQHKVPIGCAGRVYGHHRWRPALLGFIRLP